MSSSIPSPVRNLYEFGPYRLDPVECRLLRENEPIQLPPKVFDLLVLLVNNNGKIIDKDELMSQLWPDSFVEENNLAVNISLLRKALGEGADGRKYIETIPKRGYRFIADVTNLPNASPALVLEREITTSVIIEDHIESLEDLPISIPVTEIAERALPATTSNRLSNSKMALIAGAVTAVTAVTAFWFFFLRPKPVATLSNVKVIAVLPFKTLNGDPSDESLGVGMADALITKLSNLNNLTIRPTSAILKYENSDQDPAATGRALGVQALLDGRIQRLGNRIRVTVQLLRVDDGAPIWADSFEEQFSHIFTVEDRISEKAASSLVSKLSAEQHQRLAKHYTENADAYRAYVRGRYFWNKHSDDGIKKALEYFQQAIEIDPAYALAYSGIADCYILMGTSVILVHTPNGENPYALAKAAATKALEIDDNIAEAHTSLAATMLYDGDDPGGHRELDRAIALNPNYATAYSYYAVDLIGDGLLDEALAKIKRAQEIDPLSVPINMNVGAVYYRRREYDKAEEQLKRTLEMDPNAPRARWLAGQVYEQQGKFDQAIDELKQAVSLTNGLPLSLAALGHAYAVSGNHNEAVKILRELEEMSKHRRVSSYYMAVIYVGLGDNDQAFVWLNKAKENHELSLIKIDQQMDPVRSDPRFASLMQ